MNNGETQEGLNLMAPAFQDMGKTSIKLVNLKVTNKDGGEVGTGACIIDIIDGNGFPIKTFSWKAAGRGENKTWGWAEGLTKVDESVVFGRGVGMLFTAENEGDILTSSGEVNGDAIDFADTVEGLNVIANPYPVEVKLNTITVSNKDGGEVGTGACIIDIIDGNGFPTKTYSWKAAGRGESKTWGWAEGLTKIDDSVVIKPGQALLFTAEHDGDILSFPKAL